MNFEQLLQSCEKAHNYLQGIAVSAVNQSLTIRNWLFGYYIVEFEQSGEDRAKYGTKLLKKLENKLSGINIKGLSERSLRNCRQFYLMYPEIGRALSDFALPGSIWQSPPAKSTKDLNHVASKGADPKILLSKLSFTHIIELAREEDPLKRSFYETQAIQGNWSVKELQRQMGSLLFERTCLSTDTKGLLLENNKKAELSTPEEIMRDPYVFEFVGLEPKEKYTECDLEEALIGHLQVFLLELGTGFCFEARQKRLNIDGEHYYVDMVFYHRILKCHILIDLKSRKFHHVDAGQMNFYLNYYRDNEMAEGDNPPIGIMLCTDKRSSTVKYATGSLDNYLFVSRYQVQLPSSEELEKFIRQDVKLLGIDRDD